MPFISGEKIDLIPFNKEHKDLYIQWVNDEEIRKPVGFVFPRSHEGSEMLFTYPSNDARKLAHFEIWHKKDKKPIGTIALFDIDWENRLAKIGYFIGEKSYWGQGIGTEVIKLITDYGFKELNLRKIRADVYAPNIASKRCFEKVKYVLESTFVKEEYLNGQYVDIFRFTMFKDEWES
ncbi:MAG: GNAT family N-acetyltransferase [Promethearchaeota archaeon]